MLFFFPKMIWEKNSLNYIKKGHIIFLQHQNFSKRVISPKFIQLQNFSKKYFPQLIQKR
jgi:hypothetical protein